MFNRLSPDQVPVLRRDPVDPKAKEVATPIVEQVQKRGYEALKEYAIKFKDIQNEDDPLIIPAAKLQEAFETLQEEQKQILLRTAKRITDFAQAQKASLKPMEIAIDGGFAGHFIAPVETAGCYAPGGRYPLPSSVLMTACTARVAGVKNVWVASPRPSQVTLAAAHVAQVDGFLSVGGAHAIAALAFGAGDIPACDCVVGPGNQYVTAAKAIVSGRVAIDQLAGPSECLVFVDETADVETVAADLLAQAEHDVQALPILVSTDADAIDKIEKALAAQLEVLPTAAVAREAMKAAIAVHVPNVEVGIQICDRFAPEHLELHIKNANDIAGRLNHYGGLFIGHAAAEVLGDYGAGPNHTLPTGGTARSMGGLSVLTFLRVRTWIRIDDAAQSQQLVKDSVALGEMEGLIGHARSAQRRLL